MASSPAACAVCVADVLACGAAARCAPLYPSASATLPLRSRLARAPRERTAVRGRTRGVDGGAGCPTERGRDTKNILDIYNIKRRYFFDGIGMVFVVRAWPAWPMKWDGIGMGQKIPPYPSRAEWGTKLINTDCDEKGLFHAAAVSDHRRLLVWYVVAAVLTHEDIMQHLLLLLEVVQLVGSLRAAGLDEVGAKPKGIACLT